MKAQTLHIENPSQALLTFFRKLRVEKEKHKAKLIAKKDFYTDYVFNIVQENWTIFILYRHYTTEL